MGRVIDIFHFISITVSVTCEMLQQIRERQFIEDNSVVVVDILIGYQAISLPVAKFRAVYG